MRSTTNNSIDGAMAMAVAVPVSSVAVAVSSVSVLSQGDRARMDRVEALARSGVVASVAPLLELLVDPSWAVRRSIIAVLSGFGDAAVDGLCEILVHKRDHEARLAGAVGALVASVSAERVDAEMIALVTKGVASVGATSTTATTTTTATATATTPVAHPILCDAIEILGRRCVQRAVPLFVQLSRHIDDNVASRSIEALGRIGGEGTVDALISAIELRHLFRTFPAINPLGRTGDERAIRPLSKLLDDPLYASEAARALGRTGRQSAIAPLASLFLIAHRRDSTTTTTTIGGNDLTMVRVAAVALAELRQRYESRFGNTKTIQTALRQSLGEIADASKDDEINTRHEDAIGVASERVIESLSGVTAPLELAALATVLGWLGHERAISQLVEMSSQEPPVGLAATTALRRLGSRVVTPQLLSAIRDGDCAQRLRLVSIVGAQAVGLKCGIDELLHCLDDPDGDVRVRACEALARLGNPAAVTHLFRLIADRNGRVSQAATAAIQSLGSHATKQLALEHALSTDKRTRRAALRIISYFGYPEGLDILIDAATMQDEDEKIREVAINGLPFIDDPKATDALLTVAVSATTTTPIVASQSRARTRTRTTRMRSAVMRALGQTSPKHASHSQVVALLRTSLTDVDPWTRYYACQALGRLKVIAACDSIVELVHDSSGQVRVAAVEALAHLSGEVAAQRALADCATRSEDPDMRRAALLGLGIARRPESIPILQRAARAQDSTTRLVAIGALAELEGPGVVTTLAEAASDSDEAVRSAAIAYLSTRPGVDATKALVTQLLLTTKSGRSSSSSGSSSSNNNSHDLSGREGDGEPEEHDDRERKLEALVVSGDERIEGIVEALASAADAESAELLVSALTHIGQPRSEQAIRACLGLFIDNKNKASSGTSSEHTKPTKPPVLVPMNNVYARRAAASALAALGTREARDTLLHMGSVDPDADVRHICAAAVKQPA